MTIESIPESEINIEKIKDKLLLRNSLKNNTLQEGNIGLYLPGLHDVTYWSDNISQYRHTCCIYGILLLEFEFCLEFLPPKFLPRFPLLGNLPRC